MRTGARLRCITGVPTSGTWARYAKTQSGSWPARWFLGSGPAGSSTGLIDLTVDYVRESAQEARRDRLAAPGNDDDPSWRLLRHARYFPSSRVSHRTIARVTSSGASRCTKCPALGTVTSVKSFSTHFQLSLSAPGRRY